MTRDKKVTTEQGCLCWMCKISSTCKHTVLPKIIQDRELKRAPARDALDPAFSDIYAWYTGEVRGLSSRAKSRIRRAHIREDHRYLREYVHSEDQLSRSIAEHYGVSRQTVLNAISGLGMGRASKEDRKRYESRWKEELRNDEEILTMYRAKKKP